MNKNISQYIKNTITEYNFDNTIKKENLDSYLIDIFSRYSSRKKQDDLMSELNNSYFLPGKVEWGRAVCPAENMDTRINREICSQPEKYSNIPATFF